MFAVFNRPSANLDNTDRAIAKFVLDAFRSAVEGSTVFGGVMHWDDQVFTTELRDIRENRNLDLRLVTGEADDDIPQDTEEFLRVDQRWSGG